MFPFLIMYGDGVDGGTQALICCKMEFDAIEYRIQKLTSLQIFGVLYKYVCKQTALMALSGNIPVYSVGIVRVH